MNWSRNTRGRRRSSRDDWDWESPTPSFAPDTFADRLKPRNEPRPGGDTPVERANATAVIKWFNAQKGFGFAAPEDGSPDVFVHVSTIEGLGYTDLPEGSTIVCDIARGQRGPQVATVHSVVVAPAGAPRSGRSPARDEAERPAGAMVEGTVKWFNAEKGFGFITPDGGGNDLFVHIKAVQRAGLDTLEAGDRVSVTTKPGRKGPEADSLLVI